MEVEAEVSLYFPESHQRRTTLWRIHEVLKPRGLLSLYPTHLKKFGLTFEQILSEVKQTGFQLEDEARRRLVHDDNLVRGRVFSFRRKKETLEKKASGMHRPGS